MTEPRLSSILTRAMGLRRYAQPQMKMLGSADSFMFRCEVFNPVYGIWEIVCVETFLPLCGSPWDDHFHCPEMVISAIFLTFWLQELSFLQVSDRENVFFSDSGNRGSWGDGSIGKVLAMTTQGHEFNPRPHVKGLAWCCANVTLAW